MVMWLAGIFLGLSVLLTLGIGWWLKKQAAQWDDWTERWHVQ